MHQQHTLDAFDLKALEEALHHGTVAYVTVGAHNGSQPAVTDQVAMVPATAEAAAILVQDDASRLATPGKRRSQRRSGELSVDARWSPNR